MNWVCLMCNKTPKITLQLGRPTILCGPHHQEGCLSVGRGWALWKHNLQM